MGSPLSEALRVDPNEVLGVLLHRDPISRSDLAREMGLSRASVTNIVQDFLELRIVEDNIPSMSVNGRKSIGIRLDLGDFYIVGLRINRLETTLRLFDGLGQPLQTTYRRYDADVKIDTLLDLIENGVRELIGTRDPRYFLGVGISSLGWLLERDGNIIAHTDGFSELGRKDIRAEIQGRFPHAVVVMDHDGNTSGLAEYHYHIKTTGKTPACLIHIIGGIGLGGGIIINGEIFRGAHGVAGEFGHLGVNFNSGIHTRNIESTEFNGLFEDYASPRAVRAHVASRLLDFPDTTLQEDSTPEEIYAALDAGDPLANWAVNRMAQLMAYGLAGLVFLLNPDLIILGDNFPLSQKFLERLRFHLSHYIPSVLMDLLEIRVSSAGLDGILFGSYLLLIQHYLRNDKLYDAIKQARQES